MERQQEQPDSTTEPGEHEQPGRPQRPGGWRKGVRVGRRVVLYSLGAAAAAAVGGGVFFATTRYHAGAPHRGHLALTGATVLTGEQLEPLAGGTVLIHDGVISAVGPAGEVEIPAAAERIALSGAATLLPGLIDLHVHMGTPAGGNAGLLSWPGLVVDLMRHVPDRRRALLEHGVTTVRDLGSDREWVLDLRRQVREGELEGPRVFAAGPIFTTPGGHPVATFGADPDSDFVRVPATAEDARRAVRDLVRGDDPVDVIKVVQERGDPGRRELEPFRPEMLEAIVDEAHAAGVPVAAHWGTSDDLADVLAAGVDDLEHVEARGLLAGWPEELLAELVERDVSLTPTLAVTDAAPAISGADHQRLRQRVAEFYEAGGRVVVGTDPPLQGVTFGESVHRELELLVDGGLTPQQALRAATSEAAVVLRSGEVGMVAAGRAADLVVVAGDPLRDIRATRDVRLVLRDGRVVVDHRDPGDAGPRG